MPFDPVTADMIRQQLHKILESPDFRASDRLRSFLLHIVEETLAGRTAGIKAQAIGSIVFKRGETFDSLTDPVVRVEAAKLRNKLNAYYLAKGGLSDDIVRIDIPKGSYIPSFKKIAPPAPGNGQAESGGQAKPTGIAVLPFDNIGDVREIDYLLSGLAEELAMALTKFEDLTVVTARGMNPENRVEDSPEQLAGRLGVRFLLGGNAQFDNSTIRLRINLIDAHTGKLIWAEKFESLYTVKNLFKVIDSTVEQVAARIGDSFGWIKRTLFNEFPDSYRTNELKAYEAVLYYHYWAADLSQARFSLAKEALEKAIRADPNYALPYGMLSDIYATHYQWGNKPQPEYLRLSDEFASRALVIDPQCQYGLWGKGYNHFLRGEEQEFLNFVRAAIRTNPSDTYLTAVVGVKIAVTGHWEEGRALIRKARDLNPFLPSWYHIADALFFLVNKDYDAAMQSSRLLASPSLSGPMLRTAVYGAMEEYGLARQELQEVLGINPDFRSGYKELITRMFFNREVIAALLGGLQKVGL